MNQLSAPARDEVAARFLCKHDGDASLHGDVASFAMGLGHEMRLHCAGRKSQVHIGGLTSPWIWLPADARTILERQADHEFARRRAAPASAVVAPANPLPAVSGRNYPPRMDLMLAAARAKTWSTSLTTTADSILVVSNLLPTSPAFAVRVLRNDVVQPARCASRTPVLIAVPPADGAAIGQWRC